MRNHNTPRLAVVGAVLTALAILAGACSEPQPDRSAPFSLGGNSVVKGIPPTATAFIPKSEDNGHGAPKASPTVPPAQSPSTGGGDAAKGEKVFTSVGCSACHTLQGVAGATGKVGPELTHIATVGATRQPGMSADAYIRQSVKDPGAFIAPGFSPAMPPGLVQEGPDLDALVAFLLTKQ